FNIIKPMWSKEVSMNPNTHELAQLKIRIPAHLRKQLQEESIAQQRSMNAQINFILKQFLQIPSNVQQMKDN
ncbi:Arc family DNA-binding protein, partial [Acinetobacter baumannii]